MGKGRPVQHRTIVSLTDALPIHIVVTLTLSRLKVMMTMTMIQLQM
jgi:hypothetical protein